jgi:hypothetical protein
MANSEEAMHEYIQEGIQLEDLIDYQHNSFVSTTIISKPSGTVTLFAFDRGEGLSEHTATLYCFAPSKSKSCGQSNTSELYLNS